MKHLHRIIENGEGAIIVLGLSLTQEELEALERFSPEPEAIPKFQKGMDLDQLLCWLRITKHYVSLWEEREKDYAKEILSRLYRYKCNSSAREVPRKRRRTKKSRIKKTKRSGGE